MEFFMILKSINENLAFTKGHSYITPLTLKQCIFYIRDIVLSISGSNIITIMGTPMYQRHHPH